MIILDFSQIFISNLTVQAKQNNNVINEDLVRHKVLNSIRLYNKKFKHEYGKMILACDDDDYWRLDYFKNYKASRKKTRKKSSLNWDEAFEVLDTIRNELDEHFPYTVLKIKKTEADDIIGTLTENFHDKEPILILSGDHDFMQLQKYKNVKQYNPVKKKYVVCDDPKRKLFEHIIRGDSGDGVPNILSPDNTYVDGIRSRPIREDKMEIWLSQEDLYDNPRNLFDTNAIRNFDRNKMLVDLSQIPTKYKKEILNQYKEKVGVIKRNKILSYMQKHKLKNLIQHINDF